MSSAGHSRPSRFAELWSRFVHIYQREIWQSAFLKDRSPKGCVYAVLRVLSITITAFMESRIATRAAALSYSSLLGIGPLLAIAVLVAGFALGDTNSKEIASTLDRMLKLVAPQLTELDPHVERALNTYFDDLDAKSQSDAAPGTPPGPAPAVAPTPGAAPVAQPPATVDPTLVSTIEGVIRTAQDGKIGVVGVFVLLVVVLLMFKGIEDTFNDIWGVRQGRAVLMRIVLYWTVLTLGAVLFFTAVALQSAGMFTKVFGSLLPDDIQRVSAGWIFQMLSFLMLAVMLTLFYRVIPNTRVQWRSALVGALVVTALLAANNFAAFIYVKGVLRQKSLYGGLALPLVLLSVLYIFWLCVLIGGTVSYAIQNVHFRNSQAVWSTLSESMRERLTLVVFLTICRRFRECLPPISASDLSTMLKVPTQLLNECLNRLERLQLVTTLRSPPDNTATDYLYQPARPLNRITLFDFKTLDDNLGEDPIGASLERIDPLLSQYERASNRLGEQEFFQRTIEQLFDEHPFDESRPPFAMGERRLAK